MATTSAGYGFAVGKHNSLNAFSRDEILDSTVETVNATALPVLADLEAGFGTASQACAETFGQAARGGFMRAAMEHGTFTYAAEAVADGEASRRTAGDN